MEIVAAYLIAFIIFFSFLAIFVAIANKVLPPIDSKKRVEYSKQGNYFWFKGRRYRRDGKNRRTLDEIITDEKRKKQKELGKNYDIEKINNPDINLYRKTDIKLHFQRLEKFGRSRWQKEMYFKGQRGGIYTITASGSRNYKY